MEAIVMLFTRDLRVADNPALAEACRAPWRLDGLARRRSYPALIIDPEESAVGRPGRRRSGRG